VVLAALSSDACSQKAVQACKTFEPRAGRGTRWTGANNAGTRMPHVGVSSRADGSRRILPRVRARSPSVTGARSNLSAWHSHSSITSSPASGVEPPKHSACACAETPEAAVRPSTTAPRPL